MFVIAAPFSFFFSSLAFESHEALSRDVHLFVFVRECGAFAAKPANWLVHWRTSTYSSLHF